MRRVRDTDSRSAVLDAIAMVAGSRGQVPTCLTPELKEAIVAGVRDMLDA